MKEFDALSDPVRLRMVEHLARADASAGELGSIAHREFGLSQPAASRHLRVLREAGLVRARAAGTRRIYSLDRHAIDAIGAWADSLRQAWTSALSALDAEITREQHDRTLQKETSTS